MQFRNILSFGIFLVLLSTLGQSVVIGVSPAVREVCVGPGEISNTSFYVSTNSNESFSLEALFGSDEMVLEGNQFITIESMGGVPHDIYVVEPEQGFYQTEIYYCTILPENNTYNIGDVSARYCLKADLMVNVSSECSQYGELASVILPIAKNRDSIVFLLSVLLVGVVIILVINNLSRGKKSIKLKIR